MFENLVRKKDIFLGDKIFHSVSFNNGATVSVGGYSNRKRRVEFWNGDNLEYATDLYPGTFASPSKRYFVNWKIRIFQDGNLVDETILDLRGKYVHVMVDTRSLGDNLSWTPQIDRFREATGANVVITTFYNDLFRDSYPELIWNNPGFGLPPIYASYTLGYYMGEDRFSYTPVDPRTTPLGKVPCDILGIPYTETRPKIKESIGENPLKGEKYVCIASASTAGAKYWHNEAGWQKVIDTLNGMGYKVAIIQQEPNQWENVVDLTGSIPIEHRIEVLRGAEFFVGLPSGLSWLAWAAEIPVVMISGFSDEFAEFQLDLYRVTNKSVCNSCWNDPSQIFDKGDWWWCPRNKNTERHFECTKTITPEMVMEKIYQLREEKNLL